MTEALSREKLIRLVERIRAGSEDGTQDDVVEWLTLLENNVPDPDVSDLIFHSEHRMTSEQIIERALAYKPIQL